MTALCLFLPLFLLLVLGLPIFFSLGAASIAFLAFSNMRPLVIVAQRLMVGMDSFVLLAVPLFTFSGYLMEQGGLSRRLVDWVGNLFGSFRGSSGTITIICCAIFAALTGSGPATVAAIGAIMLPALLKNGYPRHTAAGMLAAGGALGPIIPPSIAMIVYGSTMNLSIPKMFIGSIIPGFIITLVYIIVNLIIVYRNPDIKVEKVTHSLTEISVSTWRALPVLILPIIVLGGIYGGVFTPTEAATVCVVYSLALGLFYRELSLSKLYEAGRKTVTTSATIALIVGVSSVFGWILAVARIPTSLTKTVVPMLANVQIYIMLLIIVLFIVGCLMETLSSIVILAPLLVPIGVELGMDPLHLGVVFCITLVVGFITPPFGINLFTAVSTTETSYVDVVRGVMPFMVVALIACVIFAVFPDTVLFLPGLTYK